MNWLETGLLMLAVSGWALAFMEWSDNRATYRHLEWERGLRRRIEEERDRYFKALTEGNEAPVKDPSK